MKANMADGRVTLKVATWNIVALSMRVVAVCRRARKMQLDVLCLQEVQISQEQRELTINLARKNGWNLHLSDALYDSAGRVDAGTAILEKVGATKIDVDLGMPGRIVCVRCKVKGGALDVYSVYGHAAQQEDASLMFNALFDHVVAVGKRAVLLGDWNRRPQDYPLGQALRTPFWECLDGNRDDIVTRGRSGYLDFGLAFRGVKALCRTQHMPFWSDHDLVQYELSLAAEPGRYVKPKPLKFASSDLVNGDLWIDVWRDQNDEFETALSQGRTDDAWQQLSIAAEMLLRKLDLDQGKLDENDHGDFPKGPFRHEDPKPEYQKFPEMRDRHSYLEKALKNLARTVRRVHVLPPGEELTKLILKAERQKEALEPYFGQELSDPAVADDADAICELAAIQVEVEAKQRIRTWRNTLQEDEGKLRDYVRHGPKVKEPTKDAFYNPSPDECAKSHENAVGQTLGAR